LPKVKKTCLRRCVCQYLQETNNAGPHATFELEIYKRARVRIVLANGFKPENVLIAINGKSIKTHAR